MNIDELTFTRFGEHASHDSWEAPEYARTPRSDGKFVEVVKDEDGLYFIYVSSDAQFTTSNANDEIVAEGVDIFVAQCVFDSIRSK
jgi:hypothetical protein